jgi:hypothetical protein
MSLIVMLNFLFIFVEVEFFRLKQVSLCLEAE